LTDMCPHFGETCYPSHPDSLSFTQKIQAAGPLKLVTPVYKDTCSLARLLLCMYFCNCYNENKNDKFWLYTMMVWWQNEGNF